MLLALPASAARPRALVVTTDFETGLLATVATQAPRRPHTLGTRIFSDAVVRVTGGWPVVLNRFLADNVQVLSRRLRTRLQCTTGAGSNPHDILAVARDKAYLTRYGARELWIVDPSVRRCRRFRRGTIDLRTFADDDGLPEMDQMALVGTRLFVSVQRLDRDRGFLPSGQSRLVVIDTTTDAVAGEIVLSGKNAFGDASGLVRDPASGRLAVSTPGDLFTIGDGGIEWVDPETLAPAGSFFVTEEDLGGNVTDFVLLSATRGYAIVQGPSLRNHLVRFDPTDPRTATSLFSRDAYLPDVALAPDGLVWLADQSRPSPGIRVLDPASDAFVTAGPIDVGLPPFSMGFLP